MLKIAVDAPRQMQATVNCIRPAFDREHVSAASDIDNAAAAK